MMEIDALFAAAAAVRANAHAPYSRFAVGAALIDDRGRVHIGCNVENAAYPQGWCAEASALAAMVAAGGRRVNTIAIVGGPAGGAEILCPPCGGCRQKLREFMAGAAQVHLRAGGRHHRMSLDELLPMSFGPDHLEGKA